MLGRILTRQTMLHIAAMVVVVLAGVGFAWSGSRAEAAVLTDSPLLVSNRSSLQVCAQVAPALQGKSSTIMNRLNERMETLRATHPKWNEVYGLSVASPRFNSNCTVKIPTTLLDEADPWAVGKGFTNHPSQFRAVVLVLDDKTADVVLGNLNVKHAAYEMMQISEHEAVEVTNALVVRESYLGTQEFVDQYMSVAVSLEPVKPYERPEGATTSTIKPAGHDANN
ncbi:MAG TPA: hypothetical protein VFZ66_26380 [Herpetosiphonaceae bacterium]